MPTLILNNTHVVSGSNNSKYQLNFPGGGFSIPKGYKLGLQSLQIPYSWFNISSYNNNNSFGYKLNGITYTLNLLDGFYTIDDLNNAFQNLMYSNGHYLKDSYGNYWYPAQLSQNTTFYGIQYDAFVIPSSLPAGYTNPANVFYNTLQIPTATIMQLVVPNTNFTKIIGYSAGNYPENSQTSIYSTIGDMTPNLTPVNSVVLRCNLVSNPQSAPNDLFYAFAPDVQFGANINISPAYPGFLEVKSGSFPSIEIQLCDQNFSPLQMKDNNVCIQLILIPPNF